MSQLRPLDAVFLAIETPETPAEIGGLAILDPSTDPSGDFGFESFLDFTAERLALCPRFSWKVAEVPFGLDLPYWVEDEELDLRQHVHRAALPAPGGSEELSAFAGRFFSRPLDRTRPLWEMVFIEGLRGGRVALLWKLHHCLMDGESGAGLVELLFDLEPRPAARPLVPVPEETAAARPPSLGGMLARGVRNGALRNVALARNLTAAVGSLLGSAWTEGARPAAPRASFNGAVGRRREIAWSKLSLEPVLEIKRQLGVTVNDVILGLTGQAVRDYLLRRDELPEDSLQALVPMSMRRKGDRTVNNQVRDIAVTWGTNIEDPVERILTIHADAKRAKREASNGSPNVVQGLAESLAPAAVQLVSRFGAAFPDRIPLPGNAVVSNVRMTDFPFYIAGAKVVEMVPMSVLAPTQGLNITVVTYCGELHFGVIVDPHLCPEPWEIAEGIAKSLAALQAAAFEFEDVVR